MVSSSGDGWDSVLLSIASRSNPVIDPRAVAMVTKYFMRF